MPKTKRAKMTVKNLAIVLRQADLDMAKAIYGDGPSRGGKPFDELGPMQQKEYRFIAKAVLKAIAEAKS